MAMKVQGGKMVEMRSSANAQAFINASNMAYGGLERMSLALVNGALPINEQGPVHDALSTAERAVVKAVTIVKAGNR